MVHGMFGRLTEGSRRDRGSEMHWLTVSAQQPKREGFLGMIWARLRSRNGNRYGSTVSTVPDFLKKTYLRFGKKVSEI